jgi:hypothetical protein
MQFINRLRNPAMGSVGPHWTKEEEVGFVKSMK